MKEEELFYPTGRRKAIVIHQPLNQNLTQNIKKSTLKIRHLKFHMKFSMAELSHLS